MHHFIVNGGSAVHLRYRCRNGEQKSVHGRLKPDREMRHTQGSEPLFIGHSGDDREEEKVVWQ